MPTQCTSTKVPCHWNHLIRGVSPDGIHRARKATELVAKTLAAMSRHDAPAASVIMKKALAQLSPERTFIKAYDRVMDDLIGQIWAAQGSHRALARRMVEALVRLARSEQLIWPHYQVPEQPEIAHREPHRVTPWKRAGISRTTWLRRLDRAMGVVG
jgi:hypothetical protein